MSLDHALLGFLASEPMSGYDIKRAFDSSVSHFWNADQAQIYRTLNRLHRKQQVEFRTVNQKGRPDRKEYSITPEGLLELGQWLRSPLDDTIPREPFLLRLFFADSLEEDGLAALLAARRDQALFFREILRSVEEAQFGLVDELERSERLALATLRSGLMHVDAELAWLDDVDRLLGAGNKPGKKQKKKPRKRSEKETR